MFRACSVLHRCDSSSAMALALSFLLLLALGAPAHTQHLRHARPGPSQKAGDSLLCPISKQIQDLKNAIKRTSA